MKKLIIALALVSQFAHAGSSSKTAPVQSPIITPDVATGHHSFYRSTVSIDGDLLVCPNEEWYERAGFCRDPGGKNRWRKLKDAVPAGKIYAGYSIMIIVGSKYINVYWKEAD